MFSEVGIPHGQPIVRSRIHREFEMDSNFFAVIAFIFSAVAYIPFVSGVLKSETRPTISSWISWGLMDGTVLAGMIAQHEIAWQMVAYVLGVGAVISASLMKNASLNWTRMDTVCVAIVSASVAGWAFTGDADIAIVLSLLAAVVGSIPMVVNTLKNPANEHLLPWLLVLVGGISGVLAITNWSIAGAATPVTFLILQGAFVALIARKFLTPQAA